MYLIPRTEFNACVILAIKEVLLTLCGDLGMLNLGIICFKRFLHTSKPTLSGYKRFYSASESIHKLKISLDLFRASE